MELEKSYHRIKFSSQRIKEIFDYWESTSINKDSDKPTTRIIDRNGEYWNFDSDVEFLAEHDKTHSYSKFRKSFYLKRKKEEPLKTISLGIRFHLNATSVEIEDVDRLRILEIKSFIEQNLDQFLQPKIEQKNTNLDLKPVVFIGHGGSKDWRDLKDHLFDQHGIEVVAYETGARAGHTIRDILEEMMTKSSFAILVMTAADEQADGSMNARPNVIHEVGLFQGKLGFNKAIVALEKGTNLFSNMDGIQQLRFSPGNIKEIFGDVVAVINREFN